MHFSACGASLLQPCSLVTAQAQQPKVHIRERSGFIPVHASNGVLLFGRAVVGNWFIVWVAVRKASAQNFSLSLACHNMVHTILIRVLPIHLTTELSSGVAGGVLSSSIFCSLMKACHRSDSKTPSLSEQTHWRLQPVFFCAQSTKSLKWLKASDFFFIGNVKTQWVKSSKIVKK